MTDGPPDAPEPNATADRRPPQQARSRKTREKLIAAGRDAFARLGHDGVNLHQDILIPAGVSVGSFYHQFGDKTELLLEIIGSSAVQKRQTVIEVGLNDSQHTSFAASIEAGFAAYYRSLDDPEQAWELQFNERSSSSEAVRQLIRSGRQQWIAGLAAVIGRWEPDLDEATRVLAAESVVGLSVGLGIIYLDLSPAERSERREAMSQSAARFAIAGVLALSLDRESV